MPGLQTPLNALLGIRFPIIQAPMAGGPSTPALVAAVSGAGALGSFGHAYTSPAVMRSDAAAVRAVTDRPFMINLFAAPDAVTPPETEQAAAIAAVANYYANFGLSAPATLKGPFSPNFLEQLAAVEDIRPAVLTVHLGELPLERIQKFKAHGIRIGASATCVAEAKRAEALGLDFIVAQGGEAGGHRGSYLRDAYESLTGTLALVRMLVRAVRTPIVAAGGIMDGAGIAAVLALGAQAAQLGTAFLPTPESGAARIHKATLLEESEDTTVITEKFSGKPARGLNNRFIREMAARDAPQLPFPIQSSLTGPLRGASAKADDPDYLAMWAGQAAALSRAMPAAELVRTLVAETHETIARLNQLTKDTA